MGLEGWLSPGDPVSLPGPGSHRSLLREGWSGCRGRSCLVKVAVDVDPFWLGTSNDGHLQVGMVLWVPKSGDARWALSSGSSGAEPPELRRSRLLGGAG